LYFFFLETNGFIGRHFLSIYHTSISDHPASACTLLRPDRNLSYSFAQLFFPMHHGIVAVVIFASWLGMLAWTIMLHL
jgi:hypothetical protein